MKILIIEHGLIVDLVLKISEISFDSAPRRVLLV